MKCYGEYVAFLDGEVILRFGTKFPPSREKVLHLLKKHNYLDGINHITIPISANDAKGNYQLPTISYTPRLYNYKQKLEKQIHFENKPILFRQEPVMDDMRLKVPEEDPPVKLIKPNKLASLRFLLPKAYREEFIGDLIEMELILKAEGHPKWWIKFIMALQIINVVWHAAFFKWKELFPRPEKKEIDK